MVCSAQISKLSHGRDASLKFSSHSVSAIAVESAQGSYHASHDSHGMGIMLETPVELDQLLVDKGVVLEIILKSSLLVSIW